ncbi:hypothetical protein PLA106_26302 [Pseudomonas amygdali pv. lachrymans str. M302278]|nr:hypothetical protein PLA106_26302 [Pseudomonas amygdali pv. lachrymans str. M302278]
MLNSLLKLCATYFAIRADERSIRQSAKSALEF